MPTIIGSPIQNHLQIGTWEDFRLEVKQVEPALFHIIEEINPDKNYKLIKPTYNYGEKITDFGTICLPNTDGNVYRLDNPQTPVALQKQLGYCPTPMILQLHNGSEAFVEAGQRIIPLNVFKPGDLYGLFEVMVSLTGSPFAPCWSVTSGARSVSMGAKVTDKIGRKRLHAEYGVDEAPPLTLAAQWDDFKVITRHTRPEIPWQSSVLIFTSDWFKHEGDRRWMPFHYYIAKKSWIQSRNTRIKDEFRIVWEAFSSAIGSRRLKPSPYIVDEVMHNIFLANSAVPGFKPVDDSELFLPSLDIEYAYENIYQQLKEYAPVIIAPAVLATKNDSDSILYSLAHPTLLEGTPAIRPRTDSRQRHSIISDLREIHQLMQILSETLKQHPGYIAEFIKNSEFEYYHTEYDKFGKIALSKSLVDKDPAVITCMQRFPNKIFPHQGPFFHGFIRICRKLEA
jgi:hypothetical protein